MVLVARRTPFVDTSDIWERVYTRDLHFLYLPVSLSWSSHSPMLRETVCSHWNHEITFPVRNFCSSRSCSFSLRCGQGPSASRKELFVINLLTDGRAIYLLGSARHPKIPSIKLNHFHSNGTHVLRNCDFLIIAAMRCPCGSIQACTGSRVMRENIGVRPMHHIWSTDRTSALNILIGEYHAWVRIHVRLCGSLPEDWTYTFTSSILF